MTRGLICGFTAFLALSGAVAQQATRPGTAQKPQIEWQSDWDAAKKLALEGKKLILLDLYSDGYLLCWRMDREVYGAPQVVEMAGQFVALKADGERGGAALAKRYEIEGYPTILFLDPAGEVFGRVNGYMPPAAFADEMGKALKTFQELPSLRALLKEKPEDGEANAKIALVYAIRGKADEAEAALGRAERAKYAGVALVKAYNALGDVYQMSRRFDQAIPLFKKAEAAAKEPIDVAYAKVSLMFCYYLGKSDLATAHRYADELIALKDAPVEFVDMARKIKATTLVPVQPPVPVDAPAPPKNPD